MMEELLLLLLHCSSTFLVALASPPTLPRAGGTAGGCSPAHSSQIIHVCPLQLPWQQRREGASHSTHAALRWCSLSNTHSDASFHLKFEGITVSFNNLTSVRSSCIGTLTCSCHYCRLQTSQRKALSPDIFCFRKSTSTLCLLCEAISNADMTVTTWLSAWLNKPLPIFVFFRPTTHILVFFLIQYVIILALILSHPFCFLLTYCNPCKVWHFSCPGQPKSEKS